MPNYLLLEDATKFLLEDASFLLTEEPGSYSRSATIAGTGVVAAAGYRTVTRTASITGTGLLQTTAYKTVFRTASILGTGTLSITGQKTGAVSQQLSQVGSHRLWQRSRSITLT